MRKIKYIALFLKQIENSYELIGKKIINISKQSIIFKDVKYLLKDLANQKPVSIKLKKYYFIEVNKTFLNFQKIDTEITMDIVDMFIGKNIFSTIFSKLMTSKTTKNIFDMIIGGIIGLLTGLIIGYMVI